MNSQNTKGYNFQFVEQLDKLEFVELFIEVKK
jgi:hypothetical protein